MTAVGLRPARPEDEEFLARVYASTREEELAPVPWPPEQKAAFLRSQFDAQSAHYATHYADASFAVIEADGDPAGRLIVARWDGEIRIVDIALLPAYRGRGIGGALLRELMGEADAAGARLVIHVEQSNRALGLYTRLGFAPAGAHGIYLRMERPPGAGQAKIAS